MSLSRDTDKGSPVGMEPVGTEETETPLGMWRPVPPTDAPGLGWVGLAQWVANVYVSPKFKG